MTKKTKKLDVVYEDKDIIVINKPYNLLTISNENEKEKTLYHQVYMYLKRKNKNNKVFIVHRLDKDTSGLVVFAKSEKVKKILQNNWDATIRHYVAVVCGQMPKDRGVIKSYLKETKTLLVYSTNDTKNGKLAITEYEKVMGNDLWTMLNINIKTGRRNQIRVQLNDIGYPLIGDRKYNPKKTDPIRRLGLHANYLSFLHPVTGKKMEFDIDIPTTFIKLCQ